MRSASASDSGQTPLDQLTLGAAYTLVGSGVGGISAEEAALRLRSSSERKENHEAPLAILLLRQFRSPMLLLLIFAAVLSGYLGDTIDSVTILVILFASAIMSFYQERQANSAVKQLLSLVESKSRVIRGGLETQVPVESVVPGDIVLLEAGSSIPGDGRIIEADGLLLDEAALTGESAAVDKAGKDGKEGVLYRGTHVQSGSGKMLVLRIGAATMFGSVAHALGRARPEPQFHKGIRQYGYLLMEFTLLLTLGVFAINVTRHQPVIESLLFSLALTVGLTPQLLPAIMSITLARGAQELAREKVIVKRLEAIEDFGSMNLLCSDKTGTLTEGSLRVVSSHDMAGEESAEVLRLAQINAFGSRAYTNPIDETLEQAAPKDLEASIKVIAEISYDFKRKRQSVIVEDGDGALLITKGAVESMLQSCGDDARSAIDDRFRQLSDQGLRVLGVATKKVDRAAKATPDLEIGMEFRGLVAFEDPLRADSAETVQSLAAKGVELKLITGDNRHVAAYIAKKVGLNVDTILTGEAMRGISKAALAQLVKKTQVFAEVDPIEKERLIYACRDAGYVTGYMGDGINDGPALHAADVGLSVSTAVDVAREAADFVMLEKGLSVISRGIDEGRRIFANTMKYVFITSSANFGNMLSMAVASMFMPFLPLLPNQILLNNFLTDIPAIGIAGDEVDPVLVQKPHRWEVKSLRNFIVVFGLHSSIFDMTTFGLLIWVLRAGEKQFHTAWFAESALTELFILLVIRTRGSIWKSRPGKVLAWSCVACGVAVIGLPMTPLGRTLGFAALPLGTWGAIAAILTTYVLTAEKLKHWFFRKATSSTP